MSSPISIEFGVAGFDLTPSGPMEERVGHHHLLANRASTLGGAVIASDVNHIHFGNGETKETMELEPGSYLLTLQFADGTH